MCIAGRSVSLTITGPGHQHLAVIAVDVSGPVAVADRRIKVKSGCARLPHASRGAGAMNEVGTIVRHADQLSSTLALLAELRTRSGTAWAVVAVDIGGKIAVADRRIKV